VAQSTKKRSPGKTKRAPGRVLDKERLGIYLNDHLAGATLGVELVRRARKAAEADDLKAFLARLEIEIAADRETLARIMRALGIEQARYKVWAGWLGEKAGRLKANGSILRRSPLSDLVELEGLHLGVSGKLDLWRALERTANSELERFNIPQLIARAETQQRELQVHRLAAAERVFERPASE
jgi:hypothetical protein